MDLQRTEHAFQDGLLGRSQEILQSVRGNARESAETMFGVYRNAYWARLVEALGNDLPGLKALMGDAAFDRMARAYIAKHPSQHPSIRWAGRHLAEFLATEAPYRDEPWFADMARFDWALAFAFDAADAPAASLADLVGVPPEFWGSIRIVFHPTLDAFRTSTPVDEARPRLLEDAATQLDSAVRCDRAIMAWRIAHDVKFRAIDALEFSALQAMRDGATFGDLCELVAGEVDPETAPLRAAQILQGWLEWGIVATVGHDALGSAA
ncbi:MAG TPA: DNA-binding domain-containing protein [Dongiaceae bacterium]|nr:DNA-binding domain-containing protein [Dongiaceae bacterium]